MRVQSLWANIQGFPYPVFNLQGDIAKRSVRQIQSAWGLLGFGARLAGSKRDSRPTQFFCFRQKEVKKKQRKISRSS